MQTEGTLWSGATGADPAPSRARAKGTICRSLTTLMSRFQGPRHGCSSPDQLGSKYLAEDRAWPEAALKTTVEQTLMRGLATAGPCGPDHPDTAVHLANLAGLYRE